MLDVVSARTGSFQIKQIIDYLVPHSPDAKQAVRLRRFGISALTYTLSLALIAVSWSLGLVSPSAALEVSAAILVVNLSLYALFRSKFNVRFADPSLTRLQILLAITVLMQFVYHLDVGRDIALLACFIVFLFGVFRLNARDFTMVTLYTLAAYALVINLLMQFRPQAIQNVFLEWMSWLTLAGILPSFAAIGARISGLRLKLREREAGLRRAQAMAALGHIITGRDGSLESWSDTMPRLIGVDSTGMPRSTRAWLERIHPDDSERFRSTSIEADKRGTRMSVEYRIRHEDGGWIHVSQVMEPIDTPTDTTGEIRWFNTIRDVTRQNQAGAALQASEDRYRAMFEQSAIGIVHSTLDGSVQMVNPKFCDMVGYMHAEAIQLTMADLICPEDLEKSISGRSKLLSGTGVPYELELRLLRKDRSEIWAHVTTSLLRAADGRPSHLMSIVNDISERKQADDRIRRLNRVYSVLSGISAAIVRVSDRDELFRESCRIAVEDGGFGVAQILLVDEDSFEVWPGPSAGIDRLPVVRTSFRPGAETISPQGTTIRAIRGRIAVFVNDITVEPPVGPLRMQALARGYGSIISLPLLVRDRVVAVLLLCAKEKNFFDDQELRLLGGLAGDIAFSLDNIEKKEKLDYLALYDPLTGLANRALLSDRLSQQIRTAGQAGNRLAVAMFDIERLRTINDSLGRSAGDALIEQVAARLERAAGKMTIGRIASDHFVVVLEPIKGRSEAGRKVREILRACFEAPFSVMDSEVNISAKVGIVLAPGDGTEAETLFKNAEAALRKAKALGERHVFFSVDLTDQTTRTLTLENKLRKALENEEFVLHYQPKVELDSRRIVGVEALIRWQSPELGLVPPMKFIPLMEETGMILDAGAWALRRAALDHRSWVEQHLQAPRVAVNISSIQLRQRDFVATVEQAVSEGVAPTGIDLEITESLIMDDIEGNIAKLNAVRQLGMQIAIDDFGTGYSSLGYLAKLPVNTLKIDRSFIITMLENSDTMTLVQTMISLAHALKLKVVAEGVDDEEQAKVLRLLRCDEMQGYLFSKPVPFEQITTMLRDHSCKPARP